MVSDAVEDLVTALHEDDDWRVRMWAAYALITCDSTPGPEARSFSYALNRWPNIVIEPLARRATRSPQWVAPFAPDLREATNADSSAVQAGARQALERIDDTASEDQFVSDTADAGELAESCEEIAFDAKDERHRQLLTRVLRNAERDSDRFQTIKGLSEIFKGSSKCRVE